jgi:hypothetical protein
MRALYRYVIVVAWEAAISCRGSDTKKLASGELEEALKTV